MSGFKLTGGSAKSLMDKLNSKGGGGKYTTFKLMPREVLKNGKKTVVRTAKLLILGPVEGKEEFIFETIHYERFNNKTSPAKLVYKAASPKAFGEKDELMNLGFDLMKRDKDDETLDKYKREFWKNFMPKSQFHANVLDLNDIKKGPQVWNVPNSCYDLIKTFIADQCEGGEDLTALCDFKAGTPFLLGDNGKSGLEKRYNGSFSENPANLKLTKEQILEIVTKVYDLKKLQLPWNEEEYEKVAQYLQALAEKNGINLDMDVESDSDALEDGEEVIDEEITDEDITMPEDEELPVDESPEEETIEEETIEEEVPEFEEEAIEEEVVEEEPVKETKKTVASTAKTPAKSGLLGKSKLLGKK